MSNTAEETDSSRTIGSTSLEEPRSTAIEVTLPKVLKLQKQIEVGEQKNFLRMCY